MFEQALRMTRRDWRTGELRFLLIALIVAVAALSSVGFFVDRMRAGMTRDAHQLLGADLLVAADQPMPAQWLQQAQERGLAQAQTVVFPSMAQAGNGEQARSVLSSIKAVTPGYPLRGQLKLHGADGADRVAAGIPQAGTVWVDPQILSALDVREGGMLRLGDKDFRIAGIISVEPDRGSAFVNFAPRVMLADSDLAATNLVQVGSRVTYRLLLAGAPEPVKAFQQEVERQIEAQKMRAVRIESLENGRPEMRATLDRAEQFLSLVGLLSAMLAALAVAMAARRFMMRHLDACAMLRCFGMTQNEVTALYLIEFVLVGLAASAIGVALGYAAHLALLQWLGRFMPTALPPAGWQPALQGMATGLLLLVGFALPPILQLRNVPHNRVIRREQGTPQTLTVLTYVLGTLVFSGLLLWQAGDLKLGLLTVAGFLGGFGLFALVAWLCLRALRGLRGWFDSQSWRFAIDGLQRRPAAAVMQVVALGLGLMALLLLTVIRGDLVGAWQQATPPDAPNRFVINIQPDQRAAVTGALEQGGVAQPQLYPMIRGRLVQINGRQISAADYKEDRAKRLVDREFNLSTMKDIPPGNSIVAGNWYDDSKPEASVERGLAQTLGIQLGDRLQFDIAGQLVEAPVTSLRKLEWGSLRVNFFVIINPQAMRDAPQSWITAFHLAPSQEALGNTLTRDFPNLTVVDIGNVLRQIQEVVGQVISAVEFLFLFTLCSGVLVLYAALAGSQDERVREAGLLRALGATRAELSRAQRIEVLLVGSVAGLLAASGAAAIGWALAHYVFNFDWTFSPLVWIAGMAIGAGCSAIGGWAGLRHVLGRPPLQTLREA
ncbi:MULTISPECIES: ABC transporter permease [unclassified Herbaspirillum]|uniref:ABC transporter permease n=1 Tax=unclassified Herbaspirillum TaxID=2624150 RepID=UPI00114EBE0E|nr:MULTISPECIES: FtsX-like permease family protein [unclassified Herbaspirillum]MBB5390790.1 putative ABC transport system permease protein [Herbaspirillum sp. SJZ102]TQK04052.1 putative ABC transport system permease protein [Herbaspirillum sp. SJZ106]TQK14642.1 putative ABC transport system permease protein [Herbaspirillum sp. SJZ130]